MLVTNPIVGKEKTGSNSECGDNGNTPSLVDDELVNDVLKQKNQLGTTSVMSVVTVALNR